MTTELTTQPTQPARRSLLAAMASKYDMDPAAFQQVIAKTVMPSGASNEQMAAFLLVANTYDLNPITREIYAFPAKGGGITPVVGIDGWINLAQRRPEFDGVDFEFNAGADGKVESCTAIVYRKDRSRPVRVTEYMAECQRQTDPWRSHPRRMLRHKALIQAIRLAFGFAGIKDEDDADIIGTAHARAIVIQPEAAAVHVPMAAALEHQPQPQPAPQTTNPAQAASERQDQPDDAQEWPQMSKTIGDLVDIQGCPWLESVHSSNKTCNDDGYWRRRRGVLPSDARAAEAAALAKIAAGSGAQHPTAESSSAVAAPAKPPAAEPAPAPAPDPSDFTLIQPTAADARFDTYRRILGSAKDFASAKSIMRDIQEDGDLTDAQRDRLMSMGADVLATLEDQQ